MKEPRANPIAQGIKALFILIFKILAGLIIFLVMSFCAYGSLIFIQYSILSVAYVEPPIYPNAERLPGYHASGSGGSSALKNYCTPDNYTDVIAFMDDYFPAFKYDAATAIYYSAQANTFADIGDVLLEIGEERTITVYVTVPDDVDNCPSGTYFVIYEHIWD